MPGISPSELERIDRAIKTQLDVLRHSANTEARILGLLEGMRRELIGKLAQGDLTNWSRARINQLIKDANATIADLKNDAIEDLRKAAWYIEREIKRRENGTK